MQMSPSSFESWSVVHRERIEEALSRWIPQVPGELQHLVETMRYALAGGKRMRALLVLAASQAVHGDPRVALRAACAVEIIHAYSLVHDDLPCMDNDVMRRGRPTVHVQFGEALAVLAGDAMQSLAFELLTCDKEVPPPTQARLCNLLCRAAGHGGMAGGQAIDLESVGKRLDESTLREMHRLKTGALLKASVLMGATSGQPCSRTLQTMSEFGEALGLAFQVVDDILDATQPSERIGKTAGKDLKQAKPTYVTVLGLDAAQQHARRLRHEALAALDRCGLSQVEALVSLTELSINRVH